MRRSKRIIQLTLLLSVACVFVGQAHVPYTIGPETTIVSGPLNPDGTINYVQVINTLLSKDVTLENNAAIPLLQATTNVSNRQFMDGPARELNVTFDEDAALISLENFTSKKNDGPLSADESAALNKSRDACKEKPWKTKDFPQIAEWLEHSERAFALIDIACKKERCFVPWVSKSSPPNWLDALPPLSMFRQSGEALIMRAMLNAGEGRLPDALADIRRTQTLARFCVQQRTGISFLVAVAVETMALRGYEALAAAGDLSQSDLNAIRQELMAVPSLSSLAESNDVEKFIGLDIAMMCIRGDCQRAIGVCLGVLDPTVTIDVGDLPKTDWDELLKAIQREAVESEKRSALPFDERMKIADKLIQDAKLQKIPEGLLSFSAQEPGIKAAEEFLKMREGESRAAFADRIARWWMAGRPDVESRMYKLIARAALEREIALSTISLAEYKIAHGQYPDKLTALGNPAPFDPFSGKEIIYRRNGNGYILYSVGFNQKDDDGTGDDRPVRAEK